MIFFRTKIFIAASLLLLLSACQTIHKVIPEDTSYKEGIIFKVFELKEAQSLSFGDRTFRVPPRNKFVVLHLDIKNQSQTDQEINFNDFYLVDEDTKKSYRPKWVILDLLVIYSMRTKFKKTIKANESLKRKIAFIVPKEGTFRALIVKNKTIKLHLAPNP